ncbi:hypothetical protein PGTUg99_032426 [Puccinia graminis f. sp. tritici]|uniref:Pyridoxal phosphate homeostasis protein n=1 Tax=Puccinia graminis f. sp. tritici TaxID=56615 RepID=A0A5B0QVL9_PUCGR|nr:hypothetical protein PGTUg99_032426 [Puccinia graminis f. sp. tritici]
MNIAVTCSNGLLGQSKIPREHTVSQTFSMFLNRLAATTRTHRPYSSATRMALQAETKTADNPDERARDLLNCFNNINQQVHQAASGREVRLVAVSKLKPASDILTLYRTTGHLHFGENYVSELQEKVKAVSQIASFNRYNLLTSLSLLPFIYPQLPGDIKWHFIGALQSNKCKILGAIPNLFAVETVDSLHKAQLLEKSRSALASSVQVNPLEVYLQVNTSEEASKAGFISPSNEPILSSNLHSTAKYIKEECRWLKLAGLMTIGSIGQSKSDQGTNKDFERLVQLRDQLSESLGGLELGLSMGMSADFALAIKMGSDNVRVGSSIFGERPPFKKPET